MIMPEKYCAGLIAKSQPVSSVQTFASCRAGTP